MEAIHRAMKIEEKWYNERNEVQRQYDDDLNRLQAVRERVLHSRRMLHLAHREVYRVEAAARKCGLSLTFSSICRQYHGPRATFRKSWLNGDANCGTS
jgi:hypothetical protein